MMALDWVIINNITVVLESPRDAIILQILQKLDITNIAWYSSGTVYGADEMYFACNTPALHPELWQKARYLLSKPKDEKTEDIILLKRTAQNSHNGGRMLKNYATVLKRMRAKYGQKLVEFDSNKHNLNSTANTFSRAKWIVGSHGGALYNQLFAPSGTNVVEYMPVKTNGDLYLRHGGLMPYIFSSLLNQKYWRITKISTDGNVNMLPGIPFENATSILKIANQSS